MELTDLSVRKRDTVMAQHTGSGHSLIGLYIEEALAVTVIVHVDSIISNDATAVGQPVKRGGGREGGGLSTLIQQGA